MARKEEILEAARDYISSISLSNPSNVIHFEAGAKWADEHPNLDSLWHNASEVPQGPYIVLCDGLDNRQWVVEWFYIDMSYANWQDYVERIDVSHWAYISDLLPKGVENDKIPIKDDEKDNTL